MLLCRNVTAADRVIRVILGVALLSLIFVGPKTLWGLVGLIPLVTGAAGTCPIYRIVTSRGCARRTNGA